MTQHNDQLIVEIDEDAESLAAALTQAGLEVRQDNRVLTVVLERRRRLRPHPRRHRRPRPVPAPAGTAAPPGGRPLPRPADR